MPMRSVLRRTSQALACATALGSGAALAHLTHAEAQSGLRAWEPRQPITLVSHAGISPGDALGSRDENADGLPVPAVPRPPDPFGERLREGMVMTGATRHRLLLFTFDDGPELRTTPKLLNTLDELGIKAVFFVNATRFDSDSPRELAQAELLREIVRRGHFLGNHTYRHSPLTMLNQAEITSEMRKNEDHIFRITGGRPVLARPPYGAFSPRVGRLLGDLGYTTMLWNLSTGDTMVRTADDVASTFDRVLRRQERERGELGGIVLMHDTHGWTIEGFPRIVAGLRQRNCELLRHGEELYDFVDDPSVFFRKRGDASADTVSPFAEPDPDWLEARQAELREETTRRCEAVASRE